MGLKVLTIYFLLNLNDSPLDLGRNTSFISDFTLHINTCYLQIPNINKLLKYFLLMIMLL